MKKVLILAYDFPPYVSVGGLRPYNWLKYFKEFGIEPVVVTRQWSNKFGNELDYIAPGESPETIVEENEYGTVIKTAFRPNLSSRLLLKHGQSRFRLLRKSISAYHDFAQFLFHAGPKIGLYHGARAYLKENKVDAIIATGEPYILFSYAADLSREFNIPWIADYRDPWSQNEDRQQSMLHRFWNAHFEKKILMSASFITTVSEMFKTLIESQIKDKKIYVLPNGYDPDVMALTRQIPQQSETLQIVMVGTIYEWHPVRSFLEVLSEFVKHDADSNIELHFYGVNIAARIEQMIREDFPVLKGHVRILPKMPNEQLLQKMAAANVMLLFNYYSYLGTKIFDYLGIQRKIILCYSDDPEGEELKKQFFNINKMQGVSQRLQEDLMRETRSGTVVKDAKHLYEVFEELQAEFNVHGSIACHSVNTESYSRKIQVQRLADILLKL